MSVETRETRRVQSDSVAKGAVCLLAGQFSLLIAGYIVHAYVGRELGPVRYGLFGVVMALLVWFEVSLTGAFPYAIRKFGSENRVAMPQVARTALKGQFIYASLIFVLVELLAPWIALALGDRHLTDLIRVASLDIPVYAAYFCYLGVLNGSGAFVKQAISVSIYSGSKLAAIVVLVAMGVGVKGALLGNAGASVAGLVTARILAGPIGSGEAYPMRKLIVYVSHTAVLATVFTLLVNLDVFLVKAFIKNGQQVGAYVAASTLAKAPFFLFLAIAGVTLPSVSRAIAGEDDRLLRVYVNQSFRLHLMLLMPLTAIVSAGASGIVRLVYQSAYDDASETLSILITAYMFWGLLNGVFNLMVADRQTKYPVAATLTLVALMVASCGLILASTGIIGAALCALAVSLAGLLTTLLKVRRRFGCLVPCVSFLRITAASFIAYVVTKHFGVDGLALVGVMIGSFGAYMLALIASREITRQDFVKLASVTRS